MSIIDIRNLSYAYSNGTKALDNITLQISNSESVAIIGQNGAGKTTLVKLIKGLMKPLNGDVIVDLFNTKNYTTAQMAKFVGYVFQNPDDQIFHNDVYSEITFGPRKIKMKEKDISENVKWAAELCNLENYLKENPFDLPLSIRKFVTIASVISMRPKIIILDEPTAGQDKIGIETLSKIIKILSDKGHTIITISHDMEFVAENFKRTIVMANKKIVADNKTNEIFWNEGVLAEAMLKPPHVLKLVKECGIHNKNLLRFEEIIDYFCEKIK
ncbi:energy-coupling factor ABC transporter ATP-binding protein [Cytobacillus sp. FJAT-54145]|uniref:Energy-coupling factor ABC transporter ATP-binding protein n=1 Tax=Cytobacillus spartinae TaxID=3299023 RepID=A0ABW6K7Y0_9BACI